MSEAIIDALQAMQSDIDQVELLSQNIANQNTPGYRAVETSPQPFNVNAGSTAKEKAPLLAFRAEQGQLLQTNSELDIAVTNGGFLEVEGGRDGRTALVRGGTIEFDDAGRPTINGRALVTTASAAQSSSPEFRFSAQRAETISNAGIFFQAVTISDTSTLKLVAPGVYEAKTDLVLTDSKRTVLQGYLEQSNVNSSQVVVQMMELSKHIESVQRSLRAIDEMLGSGINELGRQ